MAQDLFRDPAQPIRAPASVLPDIGASTDSVVRLLVFLLAPLTASLVLVGLYYSDSIVLQQIVCPNFPDLYIHSSREFGLLENLQNVILATMACFAFIAARRKSLRWERVMMTLAGCFDAFLLLEETVSHTKKRSGPAISTTWEKPPFSSRTRPGSGFLCCSSWPPWRCGAPTIPWSVISCRAGGSD